MSHQSEILHSLIFLNLLVIPRGALLVYGRFFAGKFGIFSTQSEKYYFTWGRFANDEIKYRQGQIDQTSVNFKKPSNFQFCLWGSLAAHEINPDQIFQSFLSLNLDVAVEV